MEKDFFDRVTEFADELLSTNPSPEALIDIIKLLSEKYSIQIKEKDLGEQKLPQEKRSWRKYQIWFDDPNSFEGGVYGQSEDGFKQAYSEVFRFFRLVQSFRKAN